MADIQKKQVSLWIPDDLVQWFDERAKRRGQTRVGLMLDAMHAYRDTIEAREAGKGGVR